MTPPSDTQLHRAVSNALWPALQTRKWRPQRLTRAISPTGNPRSHSYNSAARIPGPEPTIEVISHAHYVRAVATSTDTRLGIGLITRITREHLYEVVNQRNVTDHTAAAFEDALDHGPTTPFHWDGPTTGYRRNPNLSEDLAALIQRIAAAATTRILTDAEDEAILAYRATNDTISLNAILASLYRAAP